MSMNESTTMNQKIEEVARELLARKSNTPWEELTSFARSTWLDIAQWHLAKISPLEKGYEQTVSSLKQSADKLRDEKDEALLNTRWIADELNQVDDSVPAIKRSIDKLKADRDTLRLSNEQLQSQVDKVKQIAQDSPELNMNNYSEDDVSALNQAMIQIATILNQQGE